MAVVQSYEGGTGVLTDLRSKSGGVFRSEDSGEKWTRVSAINPRPFYFSQIRIDPSNDQRVYLLEFALLVSDDGGRNFREDFRRRSTRIVMPSLFSPVPRRLQSRQNLKIKTNRRNRPFASACSRHRWWGLSELRRRKELGSSRKDSRWRILPDQSGRHQTVLSESLAGCRITRTGLGPAVYQARKAFAIPIGSPCPVVTVFTFCSIRLIATHFTLKASRAKCIESICVTANCAGCGPNPRKASRDIGFIGIRPWS